MRSLRVRFLILCPALFVGVASAAPVSFSRQIAPVLVDQCVECHRAEKAKGGYRLDTFEQLLKAGDSDEASITAGKPETSELYELIVAHDDADRMPKKADALPEKDVALIRLWITEGAKFDGPDMKAAMASLLPEKRTLVPEKYPRPIPVTAMALNGDGKVLVTSGYHEVLAWDPETGKLRGRLSGMPERVLSLSFVKGGPWLAIAGGVPGRSGEVWLVNFAKPAERKRLVQLRDCVLCAVTTPDGSTLITGGVDNSVRAFSLPDGKPLWNIEAHADWVLALAMSPDGKQVATASRDRTARVVDVKTGVIEGTFTGHSVPVLSVAFAPNGQEVISGATDGEVRRWKLNGEGIKDSTIRPGGRTEVLGLAFLKPDTPLAMLANGLAITMEMKSRKGKDKLTQHEDRVNALCISGSGDTQRLITASHDGQVRVVEVKTAKEMMKWIASPGW